MREKREKEKERKKRRSSVRRVNSRRLLAVFVSGLTVSRDGILAADRKKARTVSFVSARTRCSERPRPRHKERRRANFCSSVTVTSTPMLEAEFRSLKRACMSASACQPDLLSTRSLDELKTL
ncbi:PREDICTED: uncharacterized protein LOC105459329 isoform X1 [Wasmannia auropunctata]|uniref:uncharacterized protein LOC105459329 isoform X1 n=1 Tax=Wasmannia auropunctata TaxID=64793 RepID=UPI0005F019B6|nr:PREDICTED: uncharacterized protein LOC105459329 isoform X1 [Wasmannia auropunctata]